MTFATLGYNYPCDIEGSQFSGSCSHYDFWPTEKNDHRVLQGYWGISTSFSVGHLDLFQLTKTKTKQKHQKKKKKKKTPKQSFSNSSSYNIEARILVWLAQ